MFDIAFTELIVIGIVALVVIGPDKLPKIARTAGHLLGRAQRYVNDVKSDIDRELQLQDLKKLQDEINQHTQHGQSTPYKVGQVIRHDMPQEKPIQYQQEQISKHDTAQTGDSAAQQPTLASVSKIVEPSTLKPGTLN